MGCVDVHLPLTMDLCYRATNRNAFIAFVWDLGYDFHICMVPEASVLWGSVLKAPLPACVRNNVYAVARSFALEIMMMCRA